MKTITREGFDFPLQTQSQVPLTVYNVPLSEQIATVGVKDVTNTTPSQTYNPIDNTTVKPIVTGKLALPIPEKSYFEKNKPLIIGLTAGVSILVIFVIIVFSNSNKNK